MTASRLPYFFFFLAAFFFAMESSPPFVKSLVRIEARERTAQ
jgi:uncharacterized membrane protein YbaN (DUF454 family)